MHGEGRFSFPISMSYAAILQKIVQTRNLTEDFLAYAAAVDYRDRVFFSPRAETFDKNYQRANEGKVKLALLALKESWQWNSHIRGFVHQSTMY